MKKLFLVILSICFFQFLFAQNARLAQQYYQSGEYEKAATIYQKLYAQNERNNYYFDRYLNCLVALEEFADAEKAVKKQMKKNPDDLKMYVSYGNLLELQLKDKEAQEQYDKAVKKMPADKFFVTQLANAFLGLSKYDEAIKVYQKGGKLINNKYAFSYNLAELYRRKGDTDLMVEEYLNSLAANPARLQTIKTLLQRYLPAAQFAVAKQKLYERIQSQPNATQYPELLAWIFIQEEDYGKALRQVRALDRKLNENGGRVYQLAEIAFNAKDYDAAIDAYEYIIEKKGLTSSFYLDAKRQSLRARRNQLVEGFDYTKEDLTGLEQEYDTFLDEFGRSKRTASIILELAELEAFYLNDLDKSIALLSEMMEYPNINRFTLAKAKIRLADFYLMQGEVWEATLLYSQVDKEFKEDLMGHEARYRNAKLSYYAKDFQWAQAQFDVLKASTSRLISNDAIDMSVFIMDNLGLDTTAVPLELYADAELLVFQNRFEEAFDKLEDIQLKFPEHGLQDDILYLQAQVYVKQGNYQAAEMAYQKIIDDHIEEIRADNAMYELAQLYENQLNDLEKAKTLYETLFIDFSGSTYAVDARKRYRILRGDDIQ
ncbi:MAG: tetratricopeptide repeat protein [Bacteroidota bacterium]